MTEEEINIEFADFAHWVNMFYLEFVFYEW